MSKSWETKKKILELLSVKSKTLTDISRLLNLAPSTVSQHLQELEAMGAIYKADYSRKWKYYEINRQFNVAMAPNIVVSENRQMIRMGASLSVAVVLIALAYVFISSGAPHVQQGALAQQGTLFTVSDSPLNITSVPIVISSIEIQSATNGTWYDVPVQNSTFDLASLRGISQFASRVQLSSGVYDNISIELGNVSVFINNSSRSAILPSRHIYLSGTIVINGSQPNWINIDFNLSRSVHVLGNGNVAFLPNVRMNYTVGSAVSVNNATHIVTVTAPGRLAQQFSYGMNLNGAVIRNFSIPSNLRIEESSTGTLFENGTVRTGEGLNQSVNITANVSLPDTINGIHGNVTGSGSANASVSSSASGLGSGAAGITGSAAQTVGAGASQVVQGGSGVVDGATGSANAASNAAGTVSSGSQGVI